MTLGLTARVVLAVTLVASVVGATFALLIGVDAHERAAERIVEDSARSLVAASRLERTVIDLETGVRGYLLTKDPLLLQPWDAAIAAYAERAQVWLAQLGDSGQRARALALTDDIGSYVENYSVPLVARAEQGDPAASSVKVTQDGADRISRIRGAFEDYESAQNDLLARQLSSAKRASRGAVIAAGVGVIVSVGVVVALGVYLVSMMRPVRRAAVLAGRVADGDLSVRMPETGAAEMGTLESSFNRMTASLETSRAGLHNLAEEQSALRRVATLVAEDTPPARVFDAVISEISRLLGADVAVLVRYEGDEKPTVVATVTSGQNSLTARDEAPDGHHDVMTMVLEPGRVVTVEADDAGNAVAASLRAHGLRSATAVPVMVENRLWGAVFIAWRTAPPDGSEVGSKVAGFTELVATALASAQSRADLEASRARVVAASDETRRRIERNLHDSTQQRLVALGLEVRTLSRILPARSPDLDARITRIAEGLGAAVKELQDVSRGLHPALLSRGGLGPALRGLVRRSALPVRLDVQLHEEPSEPVAVGAYYIVSEALTNAAKHSGGAHVDVRALVSDGRVELWIHDDGVGGADATRGSGLIGLRDRVEALRGRIEVFSPPGEGTTVHATIPTTLASSG